MKIEIINRSSVRVPRVYLEKFLNRCEKLLSRKLKPLILVFVDHREARSINLQFRGRDYATDVLSFPAAEPKYLGELLMCPEVLQKQAKEIEFSFRDEVAYMCLHGILHLLGYDHEQDEAAATEMFELQDRVFDEALAGMKRE